MKLVDPAIERYAERRASFPSRLLEELEEETQGSTESPEMMVGRIQGSLLRMLVSLIRAKRVLEVGTFTGYSAIMMASALPEDGLLYMPGERREQPFHQLVRARLGIEVQRRLAQHRRQRQYLEPRRQGLEPGRVGGARADPRQ